MNPRLYLKNPMPGILGLCLICFLSGFWLTCQQGAQRVDEETRLALSHLAYALQMKDDLAVIDFSHNLEKMDSVIAFQALQDSKTVCAGGNRGALLNQAAPGVHFIFPSQWVCSQITGESQAHPLTLILVLQMNPGPFLGGLVGLLGCLFTGLLVWVVISKKTLSPEAPRETPPIKGNPGSVEISRTPVDLSAFTGKPFLLLDENYVVIQVSPQALPLLRKTEAELVQTHLIDLGPSPSLTEAIQKGDTHVVLSAFLSQTDLNATPYHIPKGRVLVLEKT